MTVAIVYSRALSGMHAPLVGLPETEVKESRERVRAALQNAQFGFPTSRRITVTLAPAELPKKSGRFDLPIAIDILVATEHVPGHRRSVRDQGRKSEEFPCFLSVRACRV